MLRKRTLFKETVVLLFARLFVMLLCDIATVSRHLNRDNFQQCLPISRAHIPTHLFVTDLRFDLSVTNPGEILIILQHCTNIFYDVDAF